MTGIPRALPARMRCLVLAAAVAAPGCGGALDPAPDEVRFNLLTEPPTLDWNLATDSTSIRVIGQVMRGLTLMGPELTPEPALALRWEVSDDGRVYTFRLRRDARWSDGAPVRADQFVDGWRRLLAPETAAEYAYFMYPVKNAEAINTGRITDPTALGVRAPDAHTLEVELEKPLVYFPSLTTFMVTFPVRLDLIERFGDAWTEPEHIETVGPYRLAGWHHEYKIELVANPLYYGDPPATARATGYMVGQPSTALVLFEQGALDFVDIPPLEVRRYVGRPTYRTAPQLLGYYYGFNVEVPPFDDVRVRRAFAMAIDRSEFPRVLRGGQIPTAYWLPPQMPHANTSIGLPFDPERARALLAEAGVDPTRLPPIEVVYNTNETHKLVAEKVQEQWQRHLGITVELENREWKVFLRELATDPPPVFRLGWGADYPDPDNFMSLFSSASANNHTNWRHAEFDALVAEAAREGDLERRQALYDRAQRILVEEEVPIVPFFVSSVNLAVSERVLGLEPNGMDILFLDRLRIAN